MLPTFRLRFEHLSHAFTMRRLRYSAFSASVIFRRTRCFGWVESERLKTPVICSKAGGVVVSLGVAAGPAADGCRLMAS